MITVQALVNPRDSERLSTAIERAMRETGRNVRDALTWAALTVAQSGRAIAKPGAKYHDVIVNPERKRVEKKYRMFRARKARGETLPPEVEQALEAIDTAQQYQEFLVVKLLQNGKQATIPTMLKNKRQPAALIVNRGLLRKLFGIMIGKLGSLRGASATGEVEMTKAERAARAYANTIIQPAAAFRATGRQQMVIEMGARVAYAERAFPGIIARMLNRGSKAMEGKIQREAENIAARFNGGQQARVA